MKITALKTFLVDAHRANFIFVKLYTDAGYEGVGEATVEWNERAVVARHRGAGEIPRRERPVPDRPPDPDACTGIPTGAPASVFRSALSGVEAALLDIKGKALGVPVYELLGGKHRDTRALLRQRLVLRARRPPPTIAAKAARR